MNEKILIWPKKARIVMIAIVLAIEIFASIYTLCASMVLFHDCFVVYLPLLISPIIESRSELCVRFEVLSITVTRKNVLQLLLSLLAIQRSRKTLVQPFTWKVSTKNDTLGFFFILQLGIGFTTVTVSKFTKIMSYVVILTSLC